MRRSCGWKDPWERGFASQMFAPEVASRASKARMQTIRGGLEAFRLGAGCFPEEGRRLGGTNGVGTPISSLRGPSTQQRPFVIVAIRKQKKPYKGSVLLFLGYGALASRPDQRIISFWAQGASVVPPRRDVEGSTGCGAGEGATQLAFRIPERRIRTLWVALSPRRLRGGKPSAQT